MSTEKIIRELTLERDIQDGQATLGRLFVDGNFQCYTLERPWLNNQRGVSCIPEGTYHGAIQPSPHFRRDLPELLDVPGRSQILIHMGNKPADSMGCVLVGKERDEDGHMVMRSNAALDELLAGLAGCDGFTLTVKGV